MRVEVKPQMFRWAYERARLDPEDLTHRFPKLREWEDGTAQPTLRQLEEFAHATHAPVGFLFLAEPPVEPAPIPDFRTLSQREPARPSPDLLDTVYACQQRQDWYRDFARSVGEEPLAFVGSLRRTTTAARAAATIRETLKFDLARQRSSADWQEAFRRFCEAAENAGVLVMVNGVVGTNNRRKLDPEEFRGFAIADDLAPLVFVNGADTKAAQMFTLAHELAHVWLGETALSDVALPSTPSQPVEQWCNQVAAELLVPLAELRHAHRPKAALEDEITRLGREFKVSTLVVLRRLKDLGALGDAAFRAAYAAELARLKAIIRGSGGDFYRTQTTRISKRFTRAVVVSTLEGQTLHRDAFHLLGVSKVEMLHAMGRAVGID